MMENNYKQIYFLVQFDKRMKIADGENYKKKKKYFCIEKVNNKKKPLPGICSFPWNCLLENPTNKNKKNKNTIFF